MAKIIKARSEGNQFIALQHTAPRIQFGVDLWQSWNRLHSTPFGNHFRGRVATMAIVYSAC
jgi:hypothetical protein